ASPGSVNFAAISDPSFKATQLGFGLGAYLIILFATISTNAGNIYASALGITNIATRWKMSMRRLLLVSSAIVVLLAIFTLRETTSAALPTIAFVVALYYLWGRSAWQKHLRALREARLVEASG